MFKQYKNILTPEEYNQCKYFIENASWKYGHTSTANSYSKFWNINLGEEEFFNAFFLNRIKRITGLNLEFIRIHANGHTFGQEGDWHKDSAGDNDFTFLYYFNKGDHTHIGETYFIDDDKNIVSSLPLHNTGILFKSNVLHRGSCPSPSFNDLRITIAFKLRKIDSEETSKLL